MVKRAFMAAFLLAACWLVGVAAVALAAGPEKALLAAKAMPVDGAIDGRAIAEGERPGVRWAEPLEPRPVKAPPTVIRRMSDLELVRFQAAILRPQALEGADATLAAMRAESWAKAVEAAGGSPDRAIGEILPPASFFQARLVSRRDEPELLADAKAAGAYGRAYATLRDALPGTRSATLGLEAALDALWRRSEAARSLDNGPASPLAKKDRWIPQEKALKHSHQYALDVFFTSLSRKGRNETGPVVRSMTSGIVVAASDDWSGGDRPSLYVSGGLSPKAGNGAIVYDPAHKRYYAYFHLSDVTVSAGQFVAAGQELGRGGNTGVNARKPGHGGHLHLEIHDASGGPWRSKKIRDAILSIH